MISNMGFDILQDLFSEQERAELFDDVVISSDVGLIKPSWDIFELALERLGVAADETVFIDDQPANTEGAERVGMKTILFTTNSQFEVELTALENAANA
jgi:HAD superfamily hydrolase (TIGR01509 family)